MEMKGSAFSHSDH
uniref:Uncharacterized protein n=1 Tax=Arundo donax TaxID=35708 RepID=A0A0A9A7A8_ARUDO